MRKIHRVAEQCQKISLRSLRGSLEVSTWDLLQAPPRALLHSCHRCRYRKRGLRASLLACRYLHVKGRAAPHLTLNLDLSTQQLEQSLHNMQP